MNRVSVYWIYSIKCIINSRVYIGCSGAKKHRITSHFSALKKGTHPNNPLQKDYDLYGFNVFEWEKLDETTFESRMFLEKYYIWFYGVKGRVYNMNNKCKPKDVRLFQNVPLDTLKTIAERIT